MCSPLDTHVLAGHGHAQVGSRIPASKVCFALVLLRAHGDMHTAEGQSCRAVNIQNEQKTQNVLGRTSTAISSAGDNAPSPSLLFFSQSERNCLCRSVQSMRKER